MNKLTLRDLFAVVTLAAVLVAWWIDPRSIADENRALRQEVSRLSEETAAQAKELRRLYEVLCPTDVPQPLHRMEEPDRL